MCAKWLSNVDPQRLAEGSSSSRSIDAFTVLSMQILMQHCCSTCPQFLARHGEKNDADLFEHFFFVTLFDPMNAGACNMDSAWEHGTYLY